MSHIVSITFTPHGMEARPAERYARIGVDHARLVKGQGIKGDAKSRGGKRQMNVMRAETVEHLRLDGFRAAPGELGEQLVVAGLEELALMVGMRLRLGDTAVIEITEPREPCGRFAAVQSRIKETASGRLGVMARVQTGGEIAVGDPVQVADRSEGTA